MSTPLCMMILGMRLATCDFRTIFLQPLTYVVIVLRQIIVPLLAFGLYYLLPLDVDFKIAMVVLAACPVAQVAQNFTEMLGQGQKETASMVILSTMSSVLTIPLISMLLAYMA